MTSITAPWLRALLLLACVTMTVVACDLELDLDEARTAGRTATSSGTSAAETEGIARVERVVDGDTIRVTFDGDDEVYRVRLLLVNTPEVQGEPECYGEEAAAYLAALLPAGTLVELERDVSDTDRFGRLLRYAYLDDGTLVNEALLTGGYAHVVTFPPDLREVDRFRAVEREAREAGRGLWSACPAAEDEAR